ncbi:MAG TPA: tetratricopeptide repeat protein [Gemmataceae bacterium]|nr:tetratricopeptide repeat protein [Gemmataceae bacterium]
MRMLRFWLPAVALVLGLSAFVCAEEPYMDLIRGLRAQGEPQLALELLQKLNEKPPPELATTLQLELARTRMEMALQESEEGKRLAMFAQARTEFDNFLKLNPNHPLAPQASFEIARLIASQGREHLNRARKQEGDVTAQKQALKTARPLFLDAATRLQAAAKAIEAQLAKFANPSTAEEKNAAKDLQQALLQAHLEEGINKFQLAQTFATDVEVQDRGKAMDEALKVLSKLSGEDVKSPVCWQALAWVGRCYAANEDFPKAEEAYKKVMDEKGPWAEVAQRQASYYWLLLKMKQATAQAMQKEEEAWLAKYRSYRHSPEGCGVLYLLASNQEAQAEPGIKRDPKTKRPVSVGGDALARLRVADRLLKELIEFENDFTERAATKRMRIILAIALGQSKERDIYKVNTFDECYLLALVELADLNDFVKDSKKNEDLSEEAVAKQRNTYYARAIRALDRALSLVKPSDSPKDVIEAKLTRIFCNLQLNRLYEAALLGEDLARTNTKSTKGARAALYSLDAYNRVMEDTQKRGDVNQDEARTDRNQVKRMAEFMEATWPDDSATDFARHSLGSLMEKQERHLDALEAFSRVTSSYLALASLRHQEGIACYNLMRTENDPRVTPAVKAKWFLRVTADLEKMPDLAQGADPNTALTYCLAKIQLGHLYLQRGTQLLKESTDAARAEYAKGVKVATDMTAALPKYTTLVEEKKTEVEYAIKALKLYALYGEVFIAVKANDHKAAAELYMPVIDDIKKNGIPEEDVADRYRRALADFCQIAIRSSIQAGDIPRAQDILKLLGKIKTGGNSSTPLLLVLRDVQSQVTELRKTDPKTLKELTDKFGAFLDELAKQTDLPNDVKISLAQGFHDVEKFARALEILRAIPKPPPVPKPANPTNPTQEEKDAIEKAELAIRNYHYVQLLTVRALRGEGRQLMPSDLKDKAKIKVAYAKLDEAKKLVDEIVGDQKVKGWAYQSMEVRREYIFILEDKKLYRDAMSAWQQMQAPFAKELPEKAKNEKEERIRTAYFEIKFYQIRLVYKSKLGITKDDVRAQEIRKVADQIVKIERDPLTLDMGGDYVKKLFQELIDTEEPLRTAYKAVGGKLLLSDEPQTARTSTETGNK